MDGVTHAPSRVREHARTVRGSRRCAVAAPMPGRERRVPTAPQRNVVSDAARPPASLRSRLGPPPYARPPPHTSRDMRLSHLDRPNARIAPTNDVTTKIAKKSPWPPKTPDQ